MKKKLVLMLLVFSGFIFLLHAGGQQEPEAGNGREEQRQQKGAEETSSPAWLVEDTDDYITVIDGYGNRVTVEKPVTSVVSLGMGSFFSTIRALHAEEMVAASTDYATRNKAFFSTVSKMPPIDTGASVDSEMLITLNPNFIHTNPFFLEQISDAVHSEIPIVMLGFGSTRDYEILGAIIDREDETEEFINWINSYTNIIDERIAGLSEDEYQDVFMYYGGQYGQVAPPPYGTFGKDNKRNPIITRAGGRSLSIEIPGDWITVDPEWVIEQNPSVIIRQCYILNDSPELGYGVTDDTAAKTLINSIMTKQPAFEGCDAVDDGKVYLIYGDMISDSWFISLVYMAKWLHPNLFNDMDPVKMHQEYMTRFQRLNYDVTSQGLFTYSAD